jgi:hypothetical protein
MSACGAWMRMSKRIKGDFEDLRNRIPLRQFEIFERVKLKHQSPQFVAEDLGIDRAMIDRNIHKAMTALWRLASHAEYQEEFYP